MVKWKPVTTPDDLPKDGSYYRFHYGFGEESILKWDRRKKAWVNFEGDREDGGIGNPKHYAEYIPPGE